LRKAGKLDTKKHNLLWSTTIWYRAKQTERGL